MTQNNGKRSISIVSACMTADGLPTFALNTVNVTQEEADNGIHYYLVEALLLDDGYEEPFVHFDENEAPMFLHPAVQEHVASVTPTINRSEEPACPASSN